MKQNTKQVTNQRVVMCRILRFNHRHINILQVVGGTNSSFIYNLYLYRNLRVATDVVLFRI